MRMEHIPEITMWILLWSTDDIVDCRRSMNFEPNPYIGPLGSGCDLIFIYNRSHYSVEDREWRHQQRMQIGMFHIQLPA